MRTPPSKRLWTVVTVLMLAALACSVFGPAPTATPVPFTPTPAPTATPLPPIAPNVVDQLPARGDEQKISDPVTVYFDTPMDRASTEKAFSMAGVKGQFSWSANDTAVTFKPDQPLSRAAKYSVKVGTEAKSRAGLALARELVFNVETVGYLEVTKVLPEPDTAGAAVDSVITVMFNRPVVALTDLANQAALPNPLVLTPAAEGQGSWLNTSIYVFRPSRPLAGGQTYTGRIAAGLGDVTGGQLPKDFEWKFSVAAPQVVASAPAVNQTNVPLTQPITVTFNQAMDRNSAQAAFSLSADGQAVAGAFGWADADRTLVFTPTANLPLGAGVRLTLKASALAAGQGAALGQDYVVEFNTVLPPAIKSTDPADGTQNVKPNVGFRLYFASPMDISTLDPNIEIVPKPTQVYTYWSDSDFSYYLGWDLKPSTAYQVTLQPGLRDPYGNPALKEARTLTFNTGPLAPQAYFNANGQVGVYSAYLPTELYLTTINLDAVNLELYPLTLQEFAALTGPNQYDYSQKFAPSQPRVPGGPGRIAIQNALNEQILTKVPLAAAGASLPPGLYYLKLIPPTSDIAPTYQLVVVTKSNLILKDSLTEDLVWATDLNTGQAAAGLPITLYDLNFNPIGQGQTDAQGVFRTTIKKRDNLWDRVYALSPQGDAFAVTVSDWSTGLDPWDFNINPQYYPENYRAYLYTDRPIYRLGQVVYFKGAVRAQQDARFSPPDFQTAEVVITNDRGEQVYSSTLPLTAFGTFAGEFKIADEASLGFYTVALNAPQTAQAAPGAGPNTNVLGAVSFSVAQYRKPEFQVNVTTPKPQVIQGETLPVTVDASFFFGGPVSNAPVKWSVLAADYVFQYDPHGGAPTGYFDFSDFDYTSGDAAPAYGAFGRKVMEKDGQTDAQGRATLSLPADLSDKGASQLYTIEAQVTDPAGGQQVAARVEVTVHQGQFYVGLRPAQSVGVAGQPVAVDLVAVNWDSAPTPNQKIHLDFFEHQWNCALEKNPDTGGNTWACHASDTPAGNAEATTNAQGAAQATFTPTQGGTYKVLATGVDAAGHTVKASTYVWVSAGDAYVLWRQNNNNRLDLVADRKSYRPGDTAEILIPSPFQGPALALITVERGGILKHEVLPLTNNSTIYKLEIKAGYAPNVFVSVSLVKGVDANNPAPAFRLGLVKLAVSPEQQALTVTLTPDKAKVGPRDTVNYTLKATDYSGKPVQAEFSIGVVDLAVLQLAAPNAGPILDAFYGEHGLGVRTAAGLTLSVDRANVDAAKAKGGGGGAEAGFDSVRSNFLDTAFWRAVVTTDASGQASVSVALPDNLTTWRLDARGVTVDTQVGQATVDVVATKDLLIRPVTPRFFVAGDQAQVAAVVNNNTDQAIPATVRLETQGITVTSPATQAVTIQAHDRVQVNWNVAVPTSAAANAADLTFSVEGGGLRDSSKPTLGLSPDQRLPILQYSAPEVVGTAGELTDATPRLEAISLPRRYDATQGNLEVQVAPSLAAATTPALLALENPEYDSSEAIVSAFLPNVATYVTLKKLNLAQPALQAALTERVNQAVQKLGARQNVDGGWGWWNSEESNPYLTAYVLFGLNQAQRAGFSVNAASVNNAITFLQGQLVNPAEVAATENWRLNRQAFILYVLDQAGAGNTSAGVTLFDARDRLDTYARGYLALTLGAANPSDPRVKTLLSDFANAAILSATGAHWEEQQRDAWNLNTDTRSTGILLYTLARLDPQNPLIPNVVRWLMTARTAAVWETPQETVWALLGLTEWMSASGELQANFNYRVTLNDKVLVADQATASNLQETKAARVAVADLFKDQANRLILERGAGAGRLYYTAHLNLYLPVSEVRAVSRGVSVGRQYSLVSPDCGGQKQPVCPPVTQARVGQDIRVTVSLVAPNDLYFVALEDPIPAGTEPIDTSLLTTSVVGQPPELNPADPFYYGWGWWWFSKTEIRDSKVALFANYLPRGTYEYTYVLHASLPGVYQVMPAWARETYFPEVFGRGDGGTFTIQP